MVDFSAKATNGTQAPDDDASFAPFAPDESDPPPIALPRLRDVLVSSIDRAERRAQGSEKPIALAWPSIVDHFGGGIWPGVHFITATTGIGKTAFALQQARHAAESGIPVMYVGLELDEMQIALRVVADKAGIPWSPLYTGKAGVEYIAKARIAEGKLRELPFYAFVQRPQGWSANDIGRAAERVRAEHPETGGPGSAPMLVVVDFLQILGDEQDVHSGRLVRLEPRERIGRAAYVMRDIAIRFNASVLAISSVARDKYALDAISAAKLEWDEDGQGRPVKRRVLVPDALVGLSKESGEIEYAADSVSVLVRVPGTWKDGAFDVLFVTAKGRATGARWSALHFTGFGYEEAADGGGLTLEAMRATETVRETRRAEKTKAKEKAKGDKLDADARAIATYVLANPGCLVREARACAVNDNARRWAPAVARLGGAFILSKDGCTIDLAKLKPEHCGEQVAP